MKLTPIRRVLNGLAPKTPNTRTPAIALGAPTTRGGDIFNAAQRPKVGLQALSAGVAKIAALTPNKSAYAFPSSFLNRYQALLGKAGVPAADAPEANRLLNSLLLREDKPTTAAFVRTVMETPSALNEALANISRYVENPKNAVLPSEVSDVAGAFDRMAFLPFLSSETLSSGLIGAMKTDLELGGQQLLAGAKAGVPTDLTIVGQGPTGAVFARVVSDAFTGTELNAAVVGGETTFSAGMQWYLNSPTRPFGTKQQGPGGPLNPIDARSSDADRSGRYYSLASTIDDQTIISLHSSGLPVLTAEVQSVARREGGGYLLGNSKATELQTNLVVLAAGLGDQAKPFDNGPSTAFVNGQYERMRLAIAAAKNGDSGPLRDYPLWGSSLDFFRARDQLNDPLSMFATKFTVGDLKTAGEVLPNSYLDRAAYLSKMPAAKVSDSTPAQKVVGVVGFGDSARTVLESITGFGPDNRSPKQLGVAPRLLWFVGDKGPRDCAEFYFGDLLRGFSVLETMGLPDLATLIRDRVRPIEAGTDRQVIAAYIEEVSQLLTTAKPRAYFDELLEDTELTAEQKRLAFGAFLQARDAVRPRYNQLVIPIEKGQIELVRGRVVSTSEVSATESQPARTLLVTSGGQQVLVDHAIDARGNVNGIGKVLQNITGTTQDPFTDPTKYELIEVVDPSGARQVVGKRLKGEDIILVGPAAGVVTNNTTNVGANTVSIFLNRPLNELGAAAVAQEVILRFNIGELGSPAERAAFNARLDQSLETLRQEREITADLRYAATAGFGLAASDSVLRSALEQNPLGHLTSLNALLARVKPTGSDSLRITISQNGDNGVRINAPTTLVGPLGEWVKTRAASDFLRLAVERGPVIIERAVERGAFVPVQNWL